MTNPEESTSKGSAESPSPVKASSPNSSDDPTLKRPPGYPATAPPADVEAQSQQQENLGAEAQSQQQVNLGASSSSILNRWKREDLLKRGSLVLRGVALVFSLLSFIIMASNKHGDWREFDKYEEYRYLLGISILSSLYNGFQVVRQLHQFSTGISLFEQRTISFADFVGDQIVAYLLISAASTAIPMTNRMREGADNIFTDSSAASISMAFFAFIALALSAMISGFKLSNQTYI